MQNGFDSLVLDSFTAEDAWELGHLLYARLLPFAAQKPTLVSISLANSGQVLFQVSILLIFLLITLLLSTTHTPKTFEFVLPCILLTTAWGTPKKKKTAVGSGTAPDNEVWVQRKRSTVLRFGTSTWFMHCKFAGDEEAFRLKYGMSPDKAGEYAIHGGGVPIRVKGVEGVVAVVVVSGLKQHEDHGVIFDVVRENWQ